MDSNNVISYFLFQDKFYKFVNQTCCYEQLLNTVHVLNCELLQPQRHLTDIDARFVF